MKEREIQKFVQRILSEPSRVWTTKSGKRLQILSPGRINHFEGPDFLDIGILLDGLVIVGDAEFHRNSSEWTAHHHQHDSNYKNVVLHIVFNDNAQNDFCEVLLLDEKQVLSKQENPKPEKSEILRSAEDLQHFALVRMLRKAAEAQKLLNFYSPENSFKQLTETFIHKYESKRRRPVYTEDRLDDIINHLISSSMMSFLISLKEGNCTEIPDRMLELIKTKISSEGSGFRRELVLNSVLPLALCLADEQSRINLFLWFWSTPALNKYGILSRFFPDFSQNFLWQQQGMLEYIREHGNKQNIVAEAISSYGFAEVLNFYRLGRSPFMESGD